MSKKIFDKFQDNYKKFPNKEAIISEGKRFTFSDLSGLVNQFSKALIAQGVNKGDRVAVLLRNRYETVISYLSILQIGGVEVALNPVMDSGEIISYALNDCGAKVLITNNNNIKQIKKELEGVESLETIFSINAVEKDNLIKGKIFLEFDEVLANPSLTSQEINVFIDENDLALIVYTSGTTGLPKGIMLTHKNIFSSAETASNDLTLDHDKCFLLIPLYHAFGKQILNSRFLKSDTILLHENVLFPMEILNLIIKEKVTGLVAVPAIYNLLLDVLAKSKRSYNLDGIQYVHSGGASLTYQLIFKLKEVFRNSMILNGYGLTEAGPRVSINIFYPDQPIIESKSLTCGQPFKNDKVCIVDEEGQDLNVGEVGEIIFQGAGVMKGYWNKPQESEKVLVNGWLHTGDLGEIDEKGNIYILDRKKDIIKSGGEIISPKEIENVINLHISIRESAVIGVPDNLLGERVKAFVVLEKGQTVTEEEILDLCSQKLPFSKIPSSIQFIDELPKSSLEKIKKSELRKLSKLSE